MTFIHARLTPLRYEKSPFLKFQCISRYMITAVKMIPSAVPSASDIIIVMSSFYIDSSAEFAWLKKDHIGSIQSENSCCNCYTKSYFLQFLH